MNHKNQYGIISAFKKNGELCSLQEIETKFLKFAVQHCKNNMTQTCHEIKIAKSTLYRKLKKEQ